MNPYYLLPVLKSKKSGAVPLVSITSEFKEFPAVLDTGCTFSLIEYKLANNLNRNFSPKSNCVLTCANTDTFKPMGRTLVKMQLGNKIISHNFYVVDKLPYPCVLGSDFIESNDIIPRLSTNSFWFGDGDRMQIEKVDETKGRLNFGLALLANTDCESGSVEAKIESILQKYPTVAREDGEYGRTDWTCHIIEAEGLPPSQAPYRKSPILREVINMNVKELLEKGMIRPSRSPYAAPVVLDKKKNGKYRMCIGYTRLNAQTKNNAAPMENASTILRQIPVGYYYSLIDLKSGFWQIMLSEDSIEKSAFVTQDGHFEFLVMPFGLKNAPKTFASLMRKVLQGHLDDFAKVYMDDIIIYSKTLDEHLIHIELVLKRLKLANLSINRAKSSFAKREVTFLGHIVTEKGLRKDPTKVQAIVEFPVPKNKHDMQRFHGMCQWYSSFIENFAEKAEPMCRLLRKEIPWVWGEEQQKSFLRIKDEMCNNVLLQGIDYAYPIILKCDASQTGLGAALVQAIDGIERPVMFISKTLNRSEVNAHIYEKELYAIIWSYHKLREFIEGHEFTIHTDNKAVYYLERMKEKKSKLMRWAEEIHSWNAKFEYKPGKDNLEADALSRAPISEEDSDPTMFDDPPDHHYVPLALLTFATPDIEKLKEGQLKDTELVKIMQIISGSDKTSRQAYHRFSMKNGLLMREVQVEQQKDVNSIMSQRDNRDSNTIIDRMGMSRTCQSNEEVTQTNRLGGCSNPRDLNSSHEGNKSIRTHGENTSIGNMQYIVNTNKLMFVPVIPKQLVPEFLYLFHDVPEAAHPGIKATKRILKSRYFWNGMNKDINEYVHSCSICQKVKATNAMPYGLLHSVVLPSSVFERISVDFMGPFPRSGMGRQNRFLFVVQDELSKWVELLPMKAATARRVVDCLVNQIFCRFGSPKSMLSDNGSQFTSKIVRRMCKQWKIKHYFTSPYHPQPNQTERVNRNLKAMLQAYVNDNHSTWDVHLQEFALAMRVHVHETTKVTPALLNLGREIPMPVDRNLQIDEESNLEEKIQGLSHVPDQLKEIIKWGRDNIIKTQEQNKVLYDKSHREARYEPGELVLVKNHILSSKEDGIMQKLANRYSGPYLISKQITPVTYQLVTVPEKKCIGKRHVADLKPFVQRLSQTHVPLRTSNSEELDKPEQKNTVKRKLRNTPRVNYRTLAGYKS